MARIEAALDDERIDKERADELEKELEDAELPGYKRGFGFGGPGGPGRHGPGFGGGPPGR